MNILAVFAVGLLTGSVLSVFLMLWMLGKQMEIFLQADDPWEKLSRNVENSHHTSWYVSCLIELIDRCTDQRTREKATQIFNKQTELTALQSQINPHFLYNTLECIRGQALLDDNEEIAKMTEALSAFFRYSISRKGNFVTLREELDNINNYMLIQRYRFYNRFSLEILIDEEDKVAYDYMIPKLIIQPVIENAIFHGLEEKAEGGKATIEIILTDVAMMITVSDNGVGIEKEKLQELNNRIHSPKLQIETKNSSTHTGIALPNINKRIQLLFGPQYGLNVYSTPGQGTDVEIIVPADYMRKSGWQDEERVTEDS